MQKSREEQWFNEGFSLHHAGRIEEAAERYRKVLKKYPDHAETRYLLGTACSQLGKLEEAEIHLGRALRFHPDHPEALNNLGLTLKKLNRNQEAIPLYRRAIELRPDYADAHSNLGGALEFAGELDEAEEHLRLALKLNPNLADAHYLLGLVLRDRDKYEEASKCFLRGLELKPDFASAYCDLGVIYKMWGRYEDALSCMQRSLRLDPDFYSAQSNIGTIYEELGRFGEALAAYRRASELNPEDIIARWNMALLHLRQGVLEAGWEAYEMRFGMGMAARRFSFPEWQGESLEGKRILVYAEQGLGDEVFFASCIPDLLRIAGDCIIECDPRLAPLFRRSFPRASVVGSKKSQTGWLATAPKIDVQSPSGSLPRFLRPTLESFPENPAYLQADPARIEHWRSKIALLGPGLKVGICWRSGLVKGERYKQYSSLSQWGRIFSTEGAHFVNLQYDECAEELRQAEAQFGVPILVPELDLRNELDEQAALICSLDLVISAATATVELASSLGIACFRLDAHGKPWECLGTDSMPWHPSMRCFGQPSPGDWDTPLALAANALLEMAKGEAESVEYLPLPGGSEIAASPSLESLPTYVLKEQDGWFNPEYHFLPRLLGPGAKFVDFGCGTGENAVPAAKSGSRVHAFAETAQDADLLMKSRKRNGLEKSLSVSILEEHASLDQEMDRHGLDGVSLLRIATGLANPATLDGGLHFFSANSPLVMFGIDREECPAVIERFRLQGFGVYHFVPGLDLLVPHHEELDAFSLNLFACREDRAALLEGRIVTRPTPMESFPGAEEPLWQEYLKGKDYALRHIESWQRSRERDWEVYFMALNLFAMAKSATHSPERRYASLQAAATTLHALVQESATLPRLLSFSRILSELGMREACVHLLNHVCIHLDSIREIPVEEPFLAPDPSREMENPGERMGEWIVAMLLEERERLRAFSSYFTGSESLPVLRRVADSGFASEDAKRRIGLIETRLGSSS